MLPNLFAEIIIYILLFIQFVIADLNVILRKMFENIFILYLHTKFHTRIPTRNQ
jgi:uncharacterized membrane protein